jgi:hypothetical protein
MGCSKYSLCQFLSLIQKELKAERMHAPLPILHDRIDCYIFSFCICQFSAVNCPICHLFSSDGKMLFSILFYAKICTYLTENILFLCFKIPFLFQNFCQIFRGKVLKSPYLAQIFCGWSPTHLSHEPYFQGFFLFLSFLPVLWYKRIGNFFPIISKVSWISNIH